MGTYLLVALVGFAFVLMLTLHIFLLRWGFVSGGRHWLTDEAITGDEDVEMQARQVAAAHGLLPGDVEKLPSYNYNSRGVEGEGVYTGAAASTTCAICLENFSFGDKCRLLPQCKHSFHADCVDSWLMKSALCPVCRGGVELVAEDAVPAKAREVCDV